MPESTVVNVQTSGTQSGQSKNSDSGVSNLFSWIQINTEYFSSTPGIVKIVQVIVAIICICLASPARAPTTQWFLFIVIISFIATVIWIFVYFLSVKEALNFPINWPLSILRLSLIVLPSAIVFILGCLAWKHSATPQRDGQYICTVEQDIDIKITELLNTGLISMMYLVVSVIQISAWVAAHNMQFRISNIIAGIFGLFNTLVYLFGSYLSYEEWKHTHQIR